MESATLGIEASHSEGREELPQSEEKADDQPNDPEGDENPQEERWLAHGEPRQLVALEEEASASRGAAVNVELDDLAHHGLGWIGRRTPLRIAVKGRPPGLGEVLIAARHTTSLPLASSIAPTHLGGEL
jgi:hypothetical protein